MESFYIPFSYCIVISVLFIVELVVIVDNSIIVKVT